MKTFNQRGRIGLLVLTLLAAMGLFVAACGGDDDDDDATDTATTATGGTATKAATGIPDNVGKDDKADLTGAGATFPAPIYQAWFDDYNAKVAKGVKINYQAVGSGGGIQQFTANTVQFGASDAPMSDEELSKAPDAQHVPTVIGAVVVTYNVEGVNSPLKLDATTVSKIYLGEIRNWDDAAIAALNPGVKLPAEKIQVVYRSDSSGTTYVFTDYLSKTSPDWKAKVDEQAPNWPTGQGGKGNDGVTGVVKNTTNAIGYVELNYAIAKKMAYAEIKNKAGKLVTPSVETASASAGVTLPDDCRSRSRNADGDTATRSRASRTCPSTRRQERASSRRRS
jgi:phosphate transport system substrate-binding protein